MPSLDSLFDDLLSKPDIEIDERGVGEQEISELEAALRMELPESYRRFVTRFGFARIGGSAIFGVAEDSEMSVVHTTAFVREEFEEAGFPSLPHDTCVIELYGGGGCYLLHGTNSCRKGQVSLLLDELGGEEAQYWRSFEDLLDHFLNQTQNWILI